MRKCINKLVFEHLDELYRIAHRLCNDQAQAQDLTHDLFVHLNKRYGNKIHNVDNARAWLTTIMYRLYIDSWRRNKRSPIFNDNAIAEEHCSNWDANPLEDCIQLEQQTLLHEALNKLAEDYRQVIILHDVEGFTLVEMVKIMEIPLGTLKSRLHRARRQLHNFYSKEKLPTTDDTDRRVEI